MNGILTLNWGDVGKGLIMALLGGLALPLDSALQTPGFSILTANWHTLGILALNGALVAGASYILKNLLSTNDGKVLGKIG